MQNIKAKQHRQFAFDENLLGTKNTIFLNTSQPVTTAEYKMAKIAIIYVKIAQKEAIFAVSNALWFSYLCLTLQG